MKQVPRKIALQLLRGYKAAISPWFGPACRYQPTCSEYAMKAIEVHGVVEGSLMAIGRVLRCNPFGSSGYDPVPAKCCKAALSTDCTITD
ncbi:MAG: membrane protein insertion efficiency factor YidD [Terriglobales bacterium]